MCNSHEYTRWWRIEDTSEQIVSIQGKTCLVLFHHHFKVYLAQIQALNVLGSAWFDFSNIRTAMHTNLQPHPQTLLVLTPENFHFHFYLHTCNDGALNRGGSSRIQFDNQCDTQHVSTQIDRYKLTSNFVRRCCAVFDKKSYRMFCRIFDKCKWCVKDLFIRIGWFIGKVRSFDLMFIWHPNSNFNLSVKTVWIVLLYLTAFHSRIYILQC